MRIHIIGGSGSGKSFISRKLGEKYNLKVIELDKIEWDGSEKRKVDSRKKILKKYLIYDNIIMEGVYYTWCEESFKNSDYIFYVNTPIFKQQYRILKRSFKRKLGLEDSPMKESLKSIYDLFKWNIKYNLKLKKELKIVLNEYKNKVYKIKKYEDILKIIGGENMKDLSMMIDDVKFNYRAGLIIEKGNKVLVECNPEIDFVTLPGGRVKTLESSIDALKREIYEEMSVNLDNYEVKMKALIQNFFKMDNKKYHELYFLYKIKVTKDDKNFVNEMKNKDSKASYYKWVSKNKLEEVNLLPITLRTLVKTNKFETVIINDLK